MNFFLAHMTPRIPADEPPGKMSKSYRKMKHGALVL